GQWHRGNERKERNGHEDGDQATVQRAGPLRHDLLPGRGPWDEFVTGSCRRGISGCCHGVLASRSRYATGADRPASAKIRDQRSDAYVTVAYATVGFPHAARPRRPSSSCRRRSTMFATSQRGQLSSVYSAVLGSLLIIIIGLVILIAAVIAAVAGVLANSGH